jgi:hypothetical protein
MVHALEEIRRVLVSDGTLLDLRPLGNRWPVEIVLGDSILETGRLIDMPAGLSDDQAANHAVQEATRRGWFKRNSEAIFTLYEYWDNPDEMIAYITERWVDFLQIGTDVQKATRDAWAVAGNGRRIRVKLNMLLSSWQKQ